MESVENDLRLDEADPAANEGAYVFPTSFTQQRLWFLDQLEPNQSSYIVPAAWRLTGSFDHAAATFAINRIVERHDTLRTSFAVENSEPIQVVQPFRPVPVPFEDLSQTAEPEAAAARSVLAQANLPFDLAHGPIFRCRVLRLAQDQHLLLFTTHHIVFDGWSKGIWLREFIAFYREHLSGQPAPVPELEIQYGDFAAFQREHLTGKILEDHITFWKTALQGAPAVLDLPTDRPRPAVQGRQGAGMPFDLTPELSSGLRKLARESGSTLFMVTLAAFQVMLARWTGQDDLVIGTPIASRERIELEPIIGFFANTLLMRGRIEPGDTFLDVLVRVKRFTLDAYTHQDMPFEKLVEVLQPERSLSYNPLFQVMFALNNPTYQTDSLPGLTLAAAGGGRLETKMDFHLSLVDAPGNLRGSVEYSTELFDRSTVARMLGSFQVLLESIVAEPSSAVVLLPILTLDERETVLHTFNATHAYFRDLPLHRLFEEQALRTPAAIALVAGHERISYAQLDQRANRVAHELIARGVGPDVLAGVYFERSIDLIVAILAILKSGGAYVPLDPNYPHDRILHIIEGAEARVILTTEALAAQLPADAPWMTLAAAGHQPATTPQTSVQPGNLSYVLFTSGSTGKPKGVALEHRSAATFIQWALATYTPAQLAGVLFSTSVCFDLSIYEIFSPLACGGKILLAENALALATMPARNEVTLINSVPSVVAELIRTHPIPANAHIINLCGEPLSRDLADALYSDPAVHQVINLYGPTEDTTYSTYTVVPRLGPVTIGRPLSNTQAIILSREGQLLPAGVAGELFLAGAGLARGYLHRPDLTAERFVPNPFSDDPAARMYRTGDLCRWLSNGNLDYLGRLDHQVKLRGFRIELGEIEHVLRQHATVQDAVVLLREDTPGDKRLAAYVTPQPAASLDPADLRAWVKSQLPEYMVPSAVVVLAALPQTPNGKVDRKQLPQPAASTPAESTGLAPRTRMEIVLADLWTEILHIPTVHVEDDFFQLGGHSLLAATMIARLSETVGYPIPLVTLFQAPTLGALAAAAESHGYEQQQISALIPIRKTGSKPPIFCVSRPNVNALGFLFLSRAASTQLPVYGLQSNMENDGALLPFTQQEYEEKAAEYVAVMRQTQPKGPYFLTGYCEGAHIAFEMARQLESASLEVGGLFILDVWPVENTISRPRFLIRNYGRVVRHFFQSSNRVRFDMLVRKLNRRAAVKPKAVRLSNRVVSNIDFAHHDRKHLSNVAAARYWPGKDFRPTIYNGDIVVFRMPKQPFHRIHDESLGWRARVRGRVEVIPIPGMHTHILREPGVNIVATGIEARIDRYMASRSSNQDVPAPPAHATGA